MRRNLVLLSTLLTVVFVTSPALAVTQGRIMGEVVDENGKPVEGVTVSITTPELTDYHDEVTSNKKGRFTAVFLDATKNYMFKLQKDGYRTLEEAVKPMPGANQRATFTLVSFQAEPARETSEVPTGASTLGLTAAQKVFNEGVVAMQGNDRDTAMAKFDEAIQMDPDLMQAYLAKASVLLNEKHNEEAAAAAEKVLEIEPGEPRAVEIAYDAYNALGNKEKSDQYLEQLQKSGVDVSVRLFNSGAAALNVGDDKTAAEKFRAALQENPELTPAYSALAVVLVRQGNYQEALEAADQALQREPGDARALRMRYQALRLLGRLDESAEAFQKLSSDEQIEALDLQYNKATELFNAGQTEEAAKVLEALLAVRPDHAKAHYLLGLSYTNLGNSASAREQFEKFIELAPDDPDAATAREMLKYLQTGS